MTVANGTTEPAAGEKVTPEQLRAKFRELQSEVDSTAESAKSTALAVGAAVVTAVVLGVFILGRSRGRKRTTVVEIRRV